MKISQVIAILAKQIDDKGDSELGEKFFIREKNGLLIVHKYEHTDCTRMDRQRNA